MKPFRFDVADYFDRNRAQVREDLRTYFTSFTGRWFEHWSACGDPARFDYADAAACASLRVPLSGDALAALLIEHADAITAALTACPDRETPIWELRRSDLDDGSPFMAMYWELRGLVPDVGYVRATKLMASKRPHAMPIRDRVVEQLLELEPKENDWLGWWELMYDEGFRRVVEEVSTGVVPEHTSLLRRVDVALWMEGRRRGFGGSLVSEAA